MPETQLTSIKAKFIKLLIEIASLFFLLLAIILFFALFSYNPQDPSWNNPAEGIPTNLIGITGAWLADVLLALNGLAAWLLPFSLVFLAWAVFKRPWLAANWQPFTPSLRLVGWLLILSCLSTGFSLAQVKSSLVFGTGGVLGTELSQVLQASLGNLGASLLVVLGVFIGVSLFTGWSWLVIMDELGFSLTSRLPRLYNLFTNRLAQLIPARKKSLVIKKSDLTPPAISPEVKNFTKQEPVLNLTSQQEFSLAASSTAKTSQPSLEVLDALLPKQEVQTPAELAEVGQLLETKLAEFGVEAKVVASHPGPVVTQFELELAAGIKSSKVSGLALDLARNLKVASLRVVEVLAGKSTLGIEVPNAKRQLIQLKEVLDSPEFLRTKNPLPLALGHSISGQPVIANLAKMPHLLVAGTTGSGKSVGINSMLVSLLLHNSPEKLRLIMIDPKMLELSVYEGIPHLLAPVVTDMQEAANSLRWCVAEMEKRYRLMAALGVRNLSGYNALVEASLAKGEEIKNPVEIAGGNPQPSTLETLPYVVVVIDEFADMIMLVGKKVEELIARLAQKARAAGIHLILATQRPSVDVITGLIKANIPTRLAFQVSSRIDSRTILDQGGAEQLLGNGDCLFLPTGAPQPSRLHGAFVADAEVHRLVAAWKEFGQPEYEQSILNGDVEAQALTGLEADKPPSAEDAEQDEFYDLAVAFVMETRRPSISSIQRRFKIGYNRAANIIEAMQAAGLVSAPQNNGQRQVLVENHL